MTSNNRDIWADTPQRYGLISRLLHWGMAYLLIWQFLVILTWRMFGAQDWVATVTSFGPGHGTVGLMVIVLVVIRAVWAIVCRNRRPAKGTGWSGHAASAVHITFYGLMLIIPALALVRAYGNGKGFEPWVPATGVEVAWMVTPANVAHGLLSWCLSILISGHIIMALVHRFVWKDRTLSTMTGRLKEGGANDLATLNAATDGSPLNR